MRRPERYVTCHIDVDSFANTAGVPVSGDTFCADNALAFHPVALTLKAGENRLKETL